MRNVQQTWIKNSGVRLHGAVDKFELWRLFPASRCMYRSATVQVETRRRHLGLEAFESGGCFYFFIWSITVSLHGALVG